VGTYHFDRVAAQRCRIGGLARARSGIGTACADSSCFFEQCTCFRVTVEPTANAHQRVQAAGDLEPWSLRAGRRRPALSG
jgi:hypothetical protein